MLRGAVAFGRVVVVCAVVVDAVVARADGWPMPGVASGQRGTGGGLSLVGLGLWWACVLGWVKTVDWVSRDSQKHRLQPALWGAVSALSFVFAALLAWWIPSLIGGLVLMILAWLVPALVYAILRNPKVPESERVLTYGHGVRIAASLLAPFGIEVTTPVSEEEVLPTVELVGAGGKDDAENKARRDQAAATPGFPEAIKTMLGAVVARASTLVVELDPANAVVRHEVDGVWDKPKVRQPPKSRREKETWVDVPASSREVGEAVIASVKTLAGVPATARGARGGTFAMLVDGKLRNCRMEVKTVATGEHLTVKIEAPAVTYKKLADLGMTPAVSDKLAELLAVEQGLILISGPTNSGLTTTFDLVVTSADRLLRDFVSIEDASAPPREIQNVKPVRFDARTGVSPIDALAQSLRDYPRAVITRDLRDKDLALELAKQAGDDKLVIISMKASDSIEAITRLVGVGVAPDLLARTLVGSLSQRLVRRLCPKCREDYPTPPELLARLKMTAEKLPTIRKQSEHGCRLCYGTGYLGRSAIFELASGSLLRQAVAAKADPKVLKQAATKDGMQPMRDAGMALVIEGITSLEEMQRTFAAAGESPAASRPPAPKPAAGKASAGKPPPPGPRKPLK